MPIIDIASLDDPRLRDYTELTDVALRKSLEVDEGLFIAESTKIFERAVAAGYIPRSLLVPRQWLDATTNFRAENPDIPVFVGEDAVLERLTGFHLHRGLLAAMHRKALPNAAELLAHAKTVVVLENVVDHTNVGAIFRAVAGLNADAVLVTEDCADPLYRRSIRVSMGTVLQVPWTRIPRFPEAAQLLHEAGFDIAALALDTSAMSLSEYSAGTHDKVALLLGSEGHGLSTGAVRAADTTVTIPMSNGVDSLNVASAAAVALYAITTQS